MTESDLKAVSDSFEGLEGKGLWGQVGQGQVVGRPLH